MSWNNVFGPSKDGEDVRDAVVAFLKRWLMTYVAWVEDEKGDAVGSHPAPRTWTIKNQFETFPEDQLPIVLVVDTGTTETPKMDGTGLYRAKYGLGIVCVASGTDWDNSRHNARIYATAIRNLLLQKSGCETNWIIDVDWQGDTVDPVPAEQGRSLAAVRQAFAIEAGALVNARSGLGPGAGPGDLNPPPDPTVPPADWPTVQITEVDVEKEDIVT